MDDSEWGQSRPLLQEDKAMHTIESHPRLAYIIMRWSRDEICQAVANRLAEDHGDGYVIRANNPACESGFKGTRKWQESRMSSWLEIKANGRTAKHLIDIPFKAKLKTDDPEGPVLINEKRLERDVAKTCDDLIKKFLDDLL